MEALNFLAVVVVVLLVVAFAIALIARGWVLQMDPILLRGIDASRARDLVGTYVQNVHDTRFGFPTGIFRVDERRSAPQRLVAREINFGAGSGFRIVRYGMYVPLAIVAAGVRGGCLLGMISLFAAGFFVMFFIVPVLCIAIVEVVLRWLMRSEVTTELEAVDGHEACLVRFRLRGLSAYGVRRQLRDGLARPVLPTAYGGSVVENAPEPWASDRLNVVYASGVGVAIVVAAIVVSLTPSLRGADPGSTSYGSGYADSSGYDSSGGSSSGGSSDTSGDADDTSSSEPAPDGDKQDAVDAGLTVNAARGGAYTIHPPSGWERDSDGVDHGAYIESSWVEPAAQDVRFLVDHTPGFAGTARSGAQGVRKLYWHGRVSDYAEIDFSSTDVGGRPGWRWEFESRGVHKLDTFLVACGTGYAVLGTAPADEWWAYADMYEAAIDTLAPSCDAASGDASASSDAGTDGRTPEDVMREHYERLSAGDYAAAFALMSPPYRRKQVRWELNRSTANPAVNLVRVEPAEVSGRDAWVQMTFFARDRVDVVNSDTRCRRFVGEAHLRRYGGTWRYDPLEPYYDDAVVRSSNPHCP